jgi:hypothetical protein
MARVNVEQTAFGDPRFARLGQLLAGDVPLSVLDLQRLGLGHMAAIWNVCQERGTKTLQPHEIDLTIGKTNASDFVIASGLAQLVKGGLIRIKGTKGRVEWLSNRRKDGGKGGRPKKPKGFDDDKDRGSRQNNPPAPAISPAPTSPDQVNPEQVSGDQKNKSVQGDPKGEAKGTRLPDGWRPSQESIAQIKAECPGLDLKFEHAKFSDHWASIPGSKGRKLKWESTWRNWMRRAWQDLQKRNPIAARPAHPPPPTDWKAPHKDE